MTLCNILAGFWLNMLHFDTFLFLELYNVTVHNCFNTQNGSIYRVNLSECSTFAPKNNQKARNYEGKKTLDNPDDGYDIDSRSGFVGRRAYL